MAGLFDPSRDPGPQYCDLFDDDEREETAAIDEFRVVSTATIPSAPTDRAAGLVGEGERHLIAVAGAEEMETDHAIKDMVVDCFAGPERCLAEIVETALAPGEPVNPNFGTTTIDFFHVIRKHRLPQSAWVAAWVKLYKPRVRYAKDERRHYLHLYRSTPTPLDIERCLVDPMMGRLSSMLDEHPPSSATKAVSRPLPQAYLGRSVSGEVYRVEQTLRNEAMRHLMGSIAKRRGDMSDDEAKEIISGFIEATVHEAAEEHAVCGLLQWMTNIKSRCLDMDPCAYGGAPVFLWMKGPQDTGKSHAARILERLVPPHLAAQSSVPLDMLVSGDGGKIRDLHQRLILNINEPRLRSQGRQALETLKDYVDRLTLPIRTFYTQQTEEIPRYAHLVFTTNNEPSKVIEDPSILTERRLVYISPSKMRPRLEWEELGRKNAQRREDADLQRVFNWLEPGRLWYRDQMIDVSVVARKSRADFSMRAGAFLGAPLTEDELLSDACPDYFSARSPWIATVLHHECGLEISPREIVRALRRLGGHETTSRGTRGWFCFARNSMAHTLLVRPVLRTGEKILRHAVQGYLPIRANPQRWPDFPRTYTDVVELWRKTAPEEAQHVVEEWIT